MPADTNLKMDKRYVAAARHDEAGELRQAEMLYSELLDDYADNCELLQRVGYVLMRGGKLQEAQQHFKRAVELEPANAVTHYSLGMVMKELGKEAAAADCLHEALKLNPDFIEAHLVLIELTLPFEHYLEVLKRFHEWLKPSNYVEIGVNTGRSIALAQAQTICIGIDPKPKIQYQVTAPTRIFSETSDDFFANHDLWDELGDKPVEFVFIDGLHHFDAALKDFINIERYASKETIILFHDCIPLDRTSSTRDGNTPIWSGDTWKVVLCLKQYRPDLKILTIPAPPTGLTAVTCLDPASTVLGESVNAIIDEMMPLGYEYLEPDKDSILNVTYEDWRGIQAQLK